MTSLVLDSNEIVVRPEREQYNAIRRKYQTFAEQASRQFSDAYASNFASIEDIHQKCNDVAAGMLYPIAEEAIRDLVAQGIYDIDINEFDAYLSPYLSWTEDFAEIDDKYRAIVSNAEELDAHRTQRREGRGKWRGGGFTVGGAVEGHLKAVGMNAVTGLGHMFVNGAAKLVSSAGDAIKKSALFADPTTKSSLTEAIYRLVFSVHEGLIAALTDKKPNYIGGEVSEEDASKAKRLLENVAKNRVPSESIKSVLIEAHALNPYDDNFYRHWLQTYGDKNGDLETIEDFFGVSVSSSIKKALLFARKAKLDLSTPETCERNLPELEAYARSIGYQGFSDDKDKIIAQATKLDQERRTIANVTYATMEEASAVQQKAKDELARTFKGVVYATPDEAESVRVKKTVGIGFILGVILLPYIVAWFSLRKGYSKQVRYLSFGYLVLYFVLFHFAVQSNSSNVSTPITPTNTAVAAQPIAAPSTLSTAPAKLTPPGATVAFADLYGSVSSTGDTVTLPSGEAATIWYSAPIATDAGPRFLILVARTSPDKTSNADGGKIDAVSYREDAGQWKMDAKSKEMFGVGILGIASPLAKEDLAKIESHPVRQGATGIFLPGGGTNQGYSIDYFDVLAVGNGSIEYLGRVEIGGENSGACDTTVKDGTSTCYGWKGQVQVEPSRNGMPGDILVKKTGTDNIDSKIVPAPQVRYVWASGKGYAI